MQYKFITSERANELANEYYKNDAKRLRKEVKKVLMHIQCNEDFEHFLGLADWIFCHDVLQRYDGERDFNGFLYSCLERKFKTELTYLNRNKRQADRLAISIDVPVSEDGNCTMKDILSSDYDIDREVIGVDYVYSDKTQRYMNRLSKKQRKIVEMLIHKHTFEEIQDELGINEDTLRAYTKNLTNPVLLDLLR